MSDIFLPYKILIIEDEVQTRENYVLYLKTLFEEVYEAGDAEKGLSLYKKIKPDIMIVDINLPKMNGLELLSIIRQEDYNTKVIVLTAHTNKEFLLKATALKLSKYLVKPVNRKDIKRGLESTIDELESYKIISLKKIDLKENCYWNIEDKKLICYGEDIALTAKERMFLNLLFSNQNKVFSYDEIFEYFWREENFTLNSLKNMVKRLRKKLPADIVKNVFNEGYTINL